MLDCVREGIALVGLDHELVFANAAMERLASRLSMPIPAAIGAASGLALDGVSPSDPEAYFARWEVMLADTEEPIADELEISGMVLERYTAPVDDEAGARIGRLVVLRDVTREREVDQLKSDLMSTVSHELRTPLASVLGYAELLRTRELDVSVRDEMLGTVHREAKRLSALIDDFLDVQAIEQDRCCCRASRSRSAICWPSRCGPFSRPEPDASAGADAVRRAGGRRSATGRGSPR